MSTVRVALVLWAVLGVVAGMIIGIFKSLAPLGAGMVLVGLGLLALEVASGGPKESEGVVHRGGLLPGALLLGVGVVLVPVTAQVSGATTATVVATAVASQVVAVISAGGLVGFSGSRRLSAVLAMLALGSVSLWLIASAWTPVIDVEIFQVSGVEVLLQGDDPYASGIFADPYAPGDSERFYGPGLSVGGELQFGYPYMPLGLLLAVPAVLLGDVALLHLVAVVAAAACMILLGGRRASSTFAAGLVLLLPVTAYLLAHRWNDGVVALIVVLVAVALERDRVLAADVGVGLLLATKQYAIVLVPLYLLLVSRRQGRHLLSPIVHVSLTTAAITLPFLIRNPEGFLRSTVILHFQQPFRPDSVSLLSLLPSAPPTWTIVATVAVVLAVTFWAVDRLPSGAEGWLLGSGLILGTFFLLSKQAALNYYFVVMVCLIGTYALAARRVESPVATGS